MAAGEWISPDSVPDHYLEFEPSYKNLVVESFAGVRAIVANYSTSEYVFPWSTIHDIRLYCRIEFGDVVLVALLTILWTLLRWLMAEVAFKPLAWFCNFNPSDRKKAPESFWKLMFYTTTVAYNGYLLFGTQEYAYFSRAGFVWRGWSPGAAVAPEIYFYYMAQGSFYVHSIFATLFMDEWRRDSVAMLVHHVVTASLILVSFALRYCNIALIIFILHDITDIELEFTRLNVYMKRRAGRHHPLHEWISNMGFVVFTTTWIFSRLYWYPTRALYSCSVIAMSKLRLPLSCFLTGLLWVLFALNLYWFLYIAAFLVKVLSGQIKELEDTREYDTPSNNILAKKRQDRVSQTNGLHPTDKLSYKAEKKA